MPPTVPKKEPIFADTPVRLTGAGPYNAKEDGNLKVLGRILAAVIAGVITVFAVQRAIRGMYRSFGRRYFTLPAGDAGADEGQ